MVEFICLSYSVEICTCLKKLENKIKKKKTTRINEKNSSNTLTERKYARKKKK